MKKNLLLYFNLIFFLSCNGQPKIDPIGKFESELNENAKEIFQRNSPLPFSEKLYAESSYYASFKLLENSGTNIMFDIDNGKLEVLNNKLNSYLRLENKNLKTLEYDFDYPLGNKFLFLPSITEDWNDVLINFNLKNDEVEIYLITQGEIENVFREESKSSLKYNYTCGIYFFREKNKLIYWFSLYKYKNRH